MLTKILMRHILESCYFHRLIVVEMTISLLVTWLTSLVFTWKCFTVDVVNLDLSYSNELIFDTSKLMSVSKLEQ